eukprot:4037684-Prymnesium_polylepis.1
MAPVATSFCSVIMLPLEPQPCIRRSTSHLKRGGGCETVGVGGAGRRKALHASGAVAASSALQGGDGPGGRWPRGAMTHSRTR